MKGSGDNQTTDREREQTRSSLSNDLVEFLFHSVHSSKEEAHTHHQEQVRQHTPDERGLDDDHLLIHEGQNGNDQFDSIASSVSLAPLRGERLGRLTPTQTLHSTGRRVFLPFCNVVSTADEHTRNKYTRPTVGRFPQLRNSTSPQGVWGEVVSPVWEKGPINLT